MQKNKVKKLVCTAAVYLTVCSQVIFPQMAFAATKEAVEKAGEAFVAEMAAEDAEIAGENDEAGTEATEEKVAEVNEGTAEIDETTSKSWISRCSSRGILMFTAGQA